MTTKIIASLAAIATVAAVAGGATVAYFSDTETSTGNTFAAGTIDLNVDGGNTNVVKFTVTDANPGEDGTGYWTIKNAGSLPGYLDIQPITLADDDVNCPDAEADIDTTCTATGGGELSANMDVVLFIDLNHDGVVDSGDTKIYEGKLSAINPLGYDQNLSIAAGDTTYISMNWSVPQATTNVIQSDKSTLGLTFELNQTTGQ